MCTLALLVTVFFPVNAMAYNAPVYAPNTSTGGILEEEYSTQYTDEDGFLITETTKIYGYPSSRAETEKKVTGVKSYTVSYTGVGDLLTITLDADFVYVANKADSVKSTRYYSSYKMYQYHEDKFESYEESNVEHLLESSKATIKTTYPVVFRPGTATGGKISKTIKLWVTCTNAGKIVTGSDVKNGV
jgi:hypothetical protein